LVETYGGGSPLACDTTAKRVALVKWLLLANTTLCDDLSKKNPRSLDILEGMLQKQAFICGDAFSMADITIVTYLAWVSSTAGSWAPRND